MIKVKYPEPKSLPEEVREYTHEALEYIGGLIRTAVSADEELDYLIIGMKSEKGEKYQIKVEFE